MRPVGVAAEEKPREQFAAKPLILGGQWSLVGSRAKGDFVFAGKGVGGHAVPHPRKLQAMQQQPHLGGRTGPDLHPLLRGGRDQRQEPVEAGLAALDGRRSRESMHQPRFQIAGVAEVHRRKLFAALVERKKLKVGGGVIQPGHALRRRSPRPGWNDDLEPAKVPPPVAVLAAVVEPQNPQGKNAVDRGRGFGLAHADDRLGRRAAQQPSAHIGGAEAVLQVHGRAQSIHFGADEGSGQHALQQPLVVAPRGSRARWACAGRWWAPVPGPAAWPRPCGA